MLINKEMPEGYKLETEEFLGKVVDLTPVVKKPRNNVNTFIN